MTADKAPVKCDIPAAKSLEPGRPISVVSLETCPDQLDRIELWFADAWPGWYGPGGQGDAHRDLDRCLASRDRLPRCLVAFDTGRRPVGTVSLRDSSPGSDRYPGHGSRRFWYRRPAGGRGSEPRWSPQPNGRPVRSDSAKSTHQRPARNPCFWPGTGSRWIRWPIRKVSSRFSGRCSVWLELRQQHIQRHPEDARKRCLEGFGHLFQNLAADPSSRACRPSSG